MGGYVAFGDVRSLALWERLVHGQRARIRYPTMVHGIRIPWYRIERGGAPREVAPELSLGRLQCPPATARRAERAANERHAARRWRRRPS